MPEPKEVKRALNYRAKAVLCGDSTVGKTAISQIFTSDGSHYPKSYLMTTRVDLMVKNIPMSGTEDSVELFLYDTPGKDTFADLVQMTLNDVYITVYVYDVTNRESFENIPHWHKKVEAQSPNSMGLIIANKVDLSDRVEIKAEEGEAMAQNLSMPIFQCSAKESENIEEAFSHISKRFYEQETAR